MMRKLHRIKVADQDDGFDATSTTALAGEEEGHEESERQGKRDQGAGEGASDKGVASEPPPPPEPKLSTATAKTQESEGDEEESRDRTLKIVVCGDGSSGKTSICARFSHDHFERSYHQTLGLDFFARRLTLPGDVQALLQVWDIGGQSIGGEMIEKYVYGAHAALVVYDVTNSASFENVQDWISVIRRVTKNQEKPPQLVLVGNKTDLEHRRVIRIDKHNKFAEEHGMHAHYVSAKSGDSVTLMFRQTAADLLGIVLSKADVESDIVIVTGEKSSKNIVLRGYDDTVVERITPPRAHMVPKNNQITSPKKKQRRLEQEQLVTSPQDSSVLLRTSKPPATEEAPKDRKKRKATVATFTRTPVSPSKVERPQKPTRKVVLNLEQDEAPENNDISLAHKTIEKRQRGTMYRFLKRDPSEKRVSGQRKAAGKEPVLIDLHDDEALQKLEKLDASFKDSPLIEKKAVNRRPSSSQSTRRRALSPYDQGDSGADISGTAEDPTDAQVEVNNDEVREVPRQEGEVFPEVSSDSDNDSGSEPAGMDADSSDEETKALRSRAAAVPAGFEVINEPGRIVARSPPRLPAERERDGDEKSDDSSIRMGDADLADQNGYVTENLCEATGSLLVEENGIVAKQDGGGSVEKDQPSQDVDDANLDQEEEDDEEELNIEVKPGVRHRSHQEHITSKVVSKNVTESTADCPSSEERPSSSRQVQTSSAPRENLLKKAITNRSAGRSVNSPSSPNFRFNGQYLKLADRLTSELKPIPPFECHPDLKLKENLHKMNINARVAQVRGYLRDTVFPPFPNLSAEQINPEKDVVLCELFGKFCSVPKEIEHRSLRFNNNDYVRLPHSSEHTEFQQHLREIHKLQDVTVHSVCSRLIEVLRSIHSHLTPRFRALEKYWECSDEVSRHRFLAAVKYAAFQVLLADSILTAPIPLLMPPVRSVTLSLKQCSCLMALAFFGLMPGRTQSRGKLPSFSFISMLRDSDDVCARKIPFIIHYFYMFSKMGSQNNSYLEGCVTFYRRSIPQSAIPKWEDSEKPISVVGVCADGGIEQLENALHADFANKRIGGGVLHHGAVQEEIRFLCCPDMIVSLCLCPMMEDNEAIVIIGAPTYSMCEGYSDYISWKGIGEEMEMQTLCLPRDCFGRLNSELVAFDALELSYRGGKSQYERRLINRELNKAFIAFYNPDQLKGKCVSTGNWGCGAFGGDVHLKFILQILAASQCNRDVMYYTFHDVQLSKRIDLFYGLCYKYNLTVGDVYKCLFDFPNSKFFGSEIVDAFLCYVLEQFQDNVKRIEKNRKKADS